MTNLAQKRLRGLQKHLYDRAYSEARTLMEGSSGGYLAYGERYAACLPRRFRRTSLANLLGAIRASNVVLFGDFHTLAQTQRGLLRILRTLLHRSRRRRPLLALEVFRERDQPHLDAFLEGRIDDQELLQRTDYELHWGFPWRHYRPLLMFAREFGIPVVGVNSPQAGRDPLASRDEFAAGVLAKLHRRHPRHIVICLIGEFHLADGHLPAALARRVPDAALMRIVTNVDQYYFRLRSTQHTPTEYLKLGPDFFCIMNAPPWMKWQSYAMWEETRSFALAEEEIDEEGLDAQADAYTENTFDVDYHLYEMTSNLCQFLGLEVPKHKLTNFAVYCDQFESLEDAQVFEWRATEDIDALLRRAEEDGLFFLPGSATILLTRLSLNNLAEAAGQFLHSVACGFVAEPRGNEQGFYHRILQYAAGMVASKVLNPRRKGHDLNYYRRFVRQTASKRLRPFAKRQRQIATAVLRHHDWSLQASRFGRGLPRLYREDREQDFAISREIGMLLGGELYTRVIASKIASHELARPFRVQSSDFEDLWEAVATLHYLIGSATRVRS